MLDDYSALREITPQALAEEARLFPLRDAYLFNPLGLSPAGSAGLGPLSGLWAAPNPPFGAVFTYSVKQAPSGDAKLVLTITDDTGRQVRRMDVDKTPACAVSPGTCAPIRRPGLRPAAAVAVAAVAGVGGRGGAAGHAGRAGTLPRDARRKVGDTVTPIGPPQMFRVVLPQ